MVAAIPPPPAFIRVVGVLFDCPCEGDFREEPLFEDFGVP